MYQSSDGFGTLVQQDSRRFYALLSWDTHNATEGIKNITLEGGSNSEDDFFIGSCISRYIKVSMEKKGEVEGKEILLQIGQMVGSVIEYIPMGYFTAEKPRTDEDNIEFTAYDRMMKTERPFSADGVPEETDTITALKAVERVAGVPVVTEGLSKIAMKRPDGYTCREVLSYISQLYGGFAICDRQGRICIKTYQDSGCIIGPDRYYDTFEHNDYPNIVEKLTCYTGKDKDGNSISISAGSGARGISISNPFMTKTVLDNIWKQLKGYTYMPGKLKFLGDPRIDPWDTLTVEGRDGKNYNVPVMGMTLEYDGGLTNTVEAVGKSEEEQVSDYKGPSTKEMERYYAQLVILDKAMINKLDADTAKITYATITNLNSTNANIENLRVQHGQFQDLTALNFEAANAKINILEGNYANIKTLLSGSAGIGDLQNIHLTSANAVIDSALIRTAVMQTVTIGDLLAGDISTNKFRILSDNGGIMIQGATQQWRDQNGVIRMQAGQDAKGAFTFALFDATGKGLLIDHTGIKPGAIADGIIVNDMVSESAGISASKLDIHSLFSEINNSAETIKSNRIWMDEGGQNLTQAYSQTQKNITTIQSTANSASNTASAAADAAKKALDTLSGISTLDAIGATLDNDAHVVHTMPDGSGGDYSGCSAALTVWLGDTDVSDHLDEAAAVPSAGVSGVWNAGTRTYSVTGMSTDTGYVDFAVTYGLETRLLAIGNKALTVGGRTLQVKCAGAKIKKRFSISKSKDGKIGLSYHLRSDALVLRKQKDGRTLVPSSVTFSAYKNDNGAVSSFSGIYQIEESRDAGKTYVIKYGSAAPELQVIYTPSDAGINMIRCTLYDASGVQSLDIQTVTVLADAEGLAEDIKKAQETADKAQEAIVTTNNKVAQIQTGMDGIKVNLSEITTDLHGLTDHTLLYNVKYHDNGDETTTLTAVVYRDGKDVTKEYPSYWYSWKRKTESGGTFIGYGYTITVKNSDYTFGGKVTGRFTTYKQTALAVGRGLLVVGGKALIFAASA